MHRINALRYNERTSKSNTPMPVGVKINKVATQTYPRMCKMWTDNFKLSLFGVVSQRLWGEFNA